MSQYQLFLFGPPRLTSAERTLSINLRKAVGLLAYVAVTRQPHQREALTTLLWPDADAAAGRASLRRTLHRLHQAVGDDLLTGDGDTILLRPGADLWIDVDAYQSCAACMPESAPASDLPPECLAQLEEAVAIYRDDFLAGFSLPDSQSFDEWQFYQREALRGSFAQVLVQLIHSYQTRAAYETAITYARRWLAQDPLHEPAHVKLMELYARADQRAAALRQYDLCTHILAEELDVPPEGETVALAEAIRNRRFPPAEPIRSPATGWQAGRSVSPSVRETDAGDPPTAPSHNLPPQFTPFVGRAAEVAALVERLLDPQVRLVTITGPGGIGKTRLALEVAHQLAVQQPPSPLFAKGIWYVPLDSAGATGDLIPAIVEAAGSAFYTHLPPRQQLLDYLRRKPMLLLLDSLEHLVASADLLADILAEAPGVKLLVTSREPLNLQGEWQWALTGLPYPERSGEVETLVAYDAVRLFVQSARRAKPNFALDANRAHVVQLCQIVEGMPLALELAAAWLNVLPCSEIVAQIKENLGFLAARARNVPPRQRSLLAVFDHSWQLLSPHERNVLMRLSVFRGGFRWEAAEPVANASWTDLVALLDKSLLRSAESGRYEMHELLRQYVKAKLAALSHEEAVTLRRHQEYYLNLLQRQGALLTGPQQQAALSAINDEIDNIRAAWARAAVSDWDAIDGAAESLYHFYHIRSRYHEGENAFALALDSQEGLEQTGRASTQARLARLLIFRGAFRADLGDTSMARTLLQQGLTVSSSVGSGRLRAFALNVLGVAAQWQGHHPTAEHFLTQSLDLSRAIGDSIGAASALYRLADCLLFRGRGDAAKRLAQESLAISRALGRPDWVAHALDKLGFSSFMLGEFVEAQQHYQESAACFEQIGHQLGLSLALSGLGWVAWGRGNVTSDEAAAPAERAVAIAREIGNPAHTATRLALVGQIRNGLGDPHGAKSAYEEGLALVRSIHAPMPHTLCLNGLGDVYRQLGDYRMADDYLRAGLEMASKSQLVPMTLEALVYLADLCTRAVEALAQPQTPLDCPQAAEILDFVAHHPASSHLIRKRAAQRLSELAPTLSPLPPAGAQEHTSERQLREIVAGILTTSKENLHPSTERG